jgi:stress response protein YsnF
MTRKVSATELDAETVLPLVAEEIAVEKRLMLKESVRIRRRRVEERQTEEVTLRTETATVEREDLTH